MEIKIKLHKGGIIPTKATDGSAGYDVYLPDYVIVEEGRQVLPLNFSLEIPKGYAATIEPRSGFSAKGMEGFHTLKLGHKDDNGSSRFDCDVLHGLIDSDYRGIVGVIVNNHGCKFQLHCGTRIAQMVIRKVEDITFAEIGSLTETTRGEGGFGHTKAL